MDKECVPIEALVEYARACSEAHEATMSDLDAVRRHVVNCTVCQEAIEIIKEWEQELARWVLGDDPHFSAEEEQKFQECKREVRRRLEQAGFLRAR